MLGFQLLRGKKYLSKIERWELKNRAFSLRLIWNDLAGIKSRIVLTLIFLNNCISRR